MHCSIVEIAFRGLFNNNCRSGFLHEGGGRRVFSPPRTKTYKSFERLRLIAVQIVDKLLTFLAGFVLNFSNERREI